MPGEATLCPGVPPDISQIQGPRNTSRSLEEGPRGKEARVPVSRVPSLGHGTGRSPPLGLEEGVGQVSAKSVLSAGPGPSHQGQYPDPEASYRQGPAGRGCLGDALSSVSRARNPVLWATGPCWQEPLPGTAEEEGPLSGRAPGALDTHPARPWGFPGEEA